MLVSFCKGKPYNDVCGVSWNNIFPPIKFQWRFSDIIFWFFVLSGSLRTSWTNESWKVWTWDNMSRLLKNPGLEIHSIEHSSETKGIIRESIWRLLIHQFQAKTKVNKIELSIRLIGLQPSTWVPRWPRVLLSAISKRHTKKEIFNLTWFFVELLLYQASFRRFKRKVHEGKNSDHRRNLRTTKAEKSVLGFILSRKLG